MSGPIERYLDRLDAELTVSARHRARVVDEARDHLLEARQRHEADGLERADAERAATDEFGAAATIAAAFDPEPTLMRLTGAVYVHLAVLGGFSLMAVGLAAAIGGALGLIAGPEFISGAAPGDLDAAQCARLAADGGTANCADDWSWHYLEESVLYRGLPGVPGLAIVVIHLSVARRLLPRTVWARRTTQIAAVAGAIGFTIATVSSVAGAIALEADALPAGPSQTGTGWWLSFVLAGVTATSISAAAVVATRRGASLSG